MSSKTHRSISVHTTVFAAFSTVHTKTLNDMLSRRLNNMRMLQRYATAIFSAFPVSASLKTVNNFTLAFMKKWLVDLPNKVNPRKSQMATHRKHSAGLTMKY